MNKNDDKTPKVVFLDVDGPLINTPMYYLDPMCSLRRTKFNTGSVAYVKQLLKLTGAKLVMNTTHNNHVFDNIRTVQFDLVNWGMPLEYFHETWRTDYPNIEINRGKAVTNWLAAHGNPDWVAFDDDRFTHDIRLVCVDFDRGVDLGYYRKAMKLFGHREKNLLI